jgi:hypothetical protein
MKPRYAFVIPQSDHVYRQNGLSYGQCRMAAQGQTAITLSASLLDLSWENDTHTIVLFPLVFMNPNFDRG